MAIQAIFENPATASVSASHTTIGADTQGNVFRKLPTGLVDTITTREDHGVINVKWYGAKGDGVTDDTAAINAALNQGGDVVLESAKTYRVTAKLNIQSNQTLFGNGSTILYNGAIASKTPIIEAQGRSLCGIHGVRFQSTDDDVIGFVVNGSSDITMSDCIASGCSLFYAQPVTSGMAYASVNEGNSSKRISLRGLRGVGSNNGQASILLEYARDVVLTDFTLSNYVHGVQFWGGDADHTIDGAVTNERKAKNISISHGHVVSVGGGGIWGSMGENISVSLCTTKDCGDVGIDFEGCFDAVADNCHTENCANAHITHYFYCRGIIFSNCTCTESNQYRWLYRGWNSSVNSEYNTDVKVIGCTFQGPTTGGLAICGDGSGPIRSINFSNNTLRNVRIQIDHANSNSISVCNNDIEFSYLVGYAFNAISCGGAVTVLGLYPEIVVALNKIRSGTTQGATSYAIRVACADYNSSPIAKIIGNTVTQFQKDVIIDWDGANAGTALCAIVDDNVFSSGVIDVPANAAGGGQARVTYGINYNSIGNEVPALHVEFVWNTGSVAAGATVVSPEQTLNGVGLGDHLVATCLAENGTPISLENWRVEAFCNAANKVKVRLTNLGASSEDIFYGAFSVRRTQRLFMYNL